MFRISIVLQRREYYVTSLLGAGGSDVVIANRRLNAEAPCCDACGFDFTDTPLALLFQAPWKVRVIAAGTGLVAVAKVWFLRLKHRSSPRPISSSIWGLSSDGLPKVGSAFS